MTPTVRLPAGPVTPHGAFHILRDRIPQVWLTSYDGSVRLDMMGGLAIPDRQTPERVEIADLKGLIPPWQTIDQKGATQDGVTFIDALYDPISVELDTVCHGRDPRHCRQTINYLIGAIDAKKEAQLNWFTHEMGQWWSKVRWDKGGMTDTVHTNKRQPLALRLRADKGLWQSYPYVSQFNFDYTATGDDDFEINQVSGLNTTLWTFTTSAGSGGVSVSGGMVKSTLNNQTMAARRKTYVAPSDNMVVEVTIGTIGQWYYPSDAGIDIWLRMANTGTPGADGTRLRIERHKLTVSSFNSGVETILRQQTLIVPPLPGEKWTFIAGAPALFGTVPADPRRFKVMRSNGVPIMLFKEQGTTSQIGSGFRSVGFGLHAGSSTVPATVANFNAGGNAVETQSGFLRCINAGDQDAWPEYTCFGPFDKIKIWDGPNPGPNDYVEFGPLGSAQVVQIRSDPRRYGVKDLSSAPTTAAEANALQGVFTGLLSFLTLNPVTHVLDVFQSIFGLFGGGSAPIPPQGNLYALLKGRFSKPIPAKSPGKPAEVYHVKVEMVNGTAESQVIGSLIPLRRYPY